MQWKKISEINDGLKRGAKIALVVIMLNVIAQLAAVFQTRYQLTSPIIPEQLFWEISKQFVLKAIVSAAVCVVALVLYFFQKYLFIIILGVLMFIVQRFIYL